MKCRKCGNEVDIGEVFCRECGTAIQIVPDYNPLEDEIEVPFEKKEQERNVIAQEQKRRQQKKELIRRKKQRERMLVMGAACAVLAVAVAAVIFLQYQKTNSFEYQRAQGMEYYERQEYGAAIQSFKDALYASHTVEEEIQVKLTLAECYQILGDYDRMVEILLEVVNTDKNPVYYKKLMEACEISGNTELMNRILKEVQGTEIEAALAEYQTGELTADIKGGEYHDYLSVTLTNSQPDSVIYYTLDGSEPTAISQVYTKPIVIETVGETTLRAVAVNASGLFGNELKEQYTISLVVPDAPVIGPDSGRYEYPAEVTVAVPEGGEVYYTVDGTVPNKDSSYLYTEPVIMPIGNTIFSAVAVDKYGVASIPAKKNYECTIDRPFPYDAAVIKLKNYLVSLGIMSDLNGNRGSGERIGVQFVELAEIEAAEYTEECYIFTLRRTVDGETTTLGEMLYAITTENGDVHSLSVDAEGNYSYLPENVNTQE